MPNSRITVGQFPLKLDQSLERSPVLTAVAEGTSPDPSTFESHLFESAFT